MKKKYPFFTAMKDNQKYIIVQWQAMVFGPVWFVALEDDYETIHGCF